MKLYAKQVPPELQQVPDSIDEFPRDIILFGGGPRYDTITPSLRAVQSTLPELLAIYKNCSYGVPLQESINIFRNYLSCQLGRIEPYSDAEVLTWKAALSRYLTQIESRTNILYIKAQYYATALSIYTQRGYIVSHIPATIDWMEQYVYYPEDTYSAHEVENLLIERYNAGTEWYVIESNEEPNLYYGFSSVTCYCHSTDIDTVKLELAQKFKFDRRDIVLYKFDGCVPTYSKCTSDPDIIQMCTDLF